MFTGLLEAGEHLAGARDLCAVVLHGKEPAFCAGLDKESFRSMARAGTAGAELGDLLTPAHGIANRAQQVVWQ